MFQNRKPLKLSQRIDLAALGLSPSIQSQLDSIFAGPSFPVLGGATERYDLAQQKLQGRVLYWFLAGELRLGIKFGSEAYVDARWPSFAESNPFPEYTEALQAELNKTLVLQPGQPAPDFTLSDPDGQPVSLSQFKGKGGLDGFFGRVGVGRVSAIWGRSARSRNKWLLSRSSSSMSHWTRMKELGRRPLPSTRSKASTCARTAK